ncbi:tricorn protease [Streptacidiphilus sp. MAP5-52]
MRVRGAGASASLRVMLTTDGYLSYPDIHGDLVAFVAEDDIWLAPVGGGRAWRVSADRVPAARPRFSPDGTQLAWASTRDGAPEVHVAPVAGGPARRLTHWGSAKTSVVGWSETGEVLALSTQGRRSRAHTWAHAVPLDGGPARTLPYGRVGGVAFGAGGVLLASAGMGREPAQWKRYRGGTAGRLWISAGEDGEFSRIHAELDGNIDSPMWVGDRIAFLSDHAAGEDDGEPVGRLWSSLPDGSDLRCHTEHGFYARNAATDGRRVVYHCAGELWLLNDLDEGTRPQRLEIALGGPRTDRQTYPIAASDHLGTVAPDAQARASVVEVRGTVHLLTHRDGPSRALAVTSGVRNRLPQLLPDGSSVWVTDAEGDDALEFSDGRRVLGGRLGRVEELAVSPNGSLLAVADRLGRILLVPVAEPEALREVDRSSFEQAEGLAFSPDSRWLAWSHSTAAEGMMRQIRLARTDGGSESTEPIEVTPVRFRDWSPAFTADGKHLAFLSARDFDPVYDQHVFDLSFPLAARPYLLTLAAETLSPFGPQPDGRATGGGADATADADSAARTVADTVVDTDGLAARIVPFPVPSGRYGELKAVKGGVAWLHHPLVGSLGTGRATPDASAERSSLERFDLGKLRVETLVDALDGYSVSGDGSRLVVRDHGELTVLPADRKVDKDEKDDRVAVDLGRIRVTVDPTAEWRQMFDEAARLMRDNFWRADLGGVDWDAVQARYRPLVERLGSHGDLVDLLWELQGELGTSHAYVTPPGGGARGGQGPDKARRQGFLGADLARDEQGVWRVARVLPTESSAPEARSPLAAPGVAVRAGDALLAVDGRAVDPVTGPAPLLVGAAGKPVGLTVRRSGESDSRTVVVVPLADEEPLRYHAWVADRRAHVHAVSGGRLGYLHVPDMVSNGWAQLHRDLRTEIGREGLVVDVRENRGGHTSQLVIEKLHRRVVGWDFPRDSVPTTYPFDAARGPMVAVTDEYAGSDGDIVGAAFQALKLGPVVGVRSWGGVVGIDGRYQLVDGTGVTQPRYAIWMEGYGWGLENHGVDPDVEVVCTPQDWVAGRDPQLDEAVRIALAALTEHPAAQPPALPEL